MRRDANRAPGTAERTCPCCGGSGSGAPVTVLSLWGHAFGRAHMFGAESNADQARWDAPQESKTIEQLHGEGRLRVLLQRQNASHDAILHNHLKLLRQVS